MRYIAVAILLLCFKMLSAQEYGIQWVLGNNESVLDFRNDTLINYPIGPQMPMVITEANICDSFGNLLYYTNGIYIAGKNGLQILNGDSLSPCNYTDQLACCGLNIPQATLFLPKPNDTSKYYLFHFSNDTVNGGRPGTLYYSIIDRNGNNGLGNVIEKNIPFFKGHVLREGGMTACKHANGRDYWIVMGDHYANTYYTFLLTPDTLLGPYIQNIGPSFDSPFDVMYCKFSQDGSKYAASCISGPILIMDFNRCSGEFSNPDTIFNQACSPPSSCSGAIVEFSPNGRFLYATNALILNQYDLSSSNPQADSIAVFVDDDTDNIKMDYLQSAPNGKVYASCYNGGYYFIHAVNYPDLKGDSCMYVDTAFTTLTANSANFPNMINYNLGPLVGSGCDTLNTGTKSIAVTNPLRIIPNPADKYVYVEVGMLGDYEFDLFDLTGRFVDKKETRQVDNFDTENLASGVYFLKAIDKGTGKEVEVKKVVVQH